MMTPQQLRNSILQRAIEGKLVEQRPEEGAAADLLKRIEAEKALLIKEKKLKKDKPLPPIAEDEIPFEIPESWEWVRLGECSTYGKTIQKLGPDEIQSDQWVLDLEDIEKDSGIITAIRLASEKDVKGDKSVFKQGNVLYSKLRPYLKKILVAPKDGVCSSEIVPFQMYSRISSSYIVFLLKSSYVDSVVNSASYGVKMPRVGTETMTNLLVPLPPLSEQQRIVAKIEELMPLVDRYEQAYSSLETLDSELPAKLKQAVLQYAIEGKLVEQRPEEGTAEELLTQIQAEKAQLIKDKKLKKDKPMPPIAEDKIPFEIPESWKWVSFGQTCLCLDGQRIPVKKDQRSTKEKIYRYYGATGIIDYVDQYIFDGHYLLIGEDGANLISKAKNNAFIVDGKFWLNNHAHIFSELPTCALEYLALVINAISLEPYVSGTAQPKLTQKKLLDIPVPLPPLSEQQRIVAKVEKIFSMLKVLERS